MMEFKLRRDREWYSALGLSLGVFREQIVARQVDGTEATIEIEDVWEHIQPQMWGAVQSEKVMYYAEMGDPVAAMLVGPQALAYLHEFATTVDAPWCDRQARFEDVMAGIVSRPSARDIARDEARERYVAWFREECGGEPPPVGEMGWCQFDPW